MLNVYDEYKEKLRTPEQAVRAVRSGDWVDYIVTNAFPPLLDAALAKRRDELTDVKIRGNNLLGPIMVAECDPERDHFTYNSWHMSAYERKLFDKGLCSYTPMIFRNIIEYYRYFCHVNVAMVAVTPMDRHGYFNFSCSIGVAKGILDTADMIILEVNEKLPKVSGSHDDCIHISEVDMVVEGEHDELPQIATPEPTEIDKQIASHIMPYITNGANLQLGIGGLPCVIGSLIADSDLKDLGMYTELASDAYYEIFKAGKLTNRNSYINKGKGLAGVFIGTNKLYDWIDENPGIIGYPLEIINSPAVQRNVKKLISINSGLTADLYGQVCSESVGTRQISGTGGQLDFLTGAALSEGGRAFICMPSTRTDKNGNVSSNIKPFFTGGEIITSPRSQSHLFATEYGAVNLAGKSTWERAEMLISIAHPDFREDLIKAAEEQKIWRKSNKHI
ncbi:MAG: butyryl-CoA:acetate CoA-transferase [Clostridia bacterium]|nr:butyryl-CoA:acetate CoA-transferase [Clostridia bacterium]